MADKMKTILAVAIGPERNLSISSKIAAGQARPYIDGLIEGLANYGHNIGQDYEIVYRERPNLDAKGGHLASAFGPDGGTPANLIFGMSTTVVRAANNAKLGLPIVGVVSDRKAEGLGKAGKITGISARRSQTVGEGFECFLATVPSLKRVLVLHKPKYGPSDRSLKVIGKVAKRHGVAVKPIPVKSREEIEAKLGKLPKRDSKKAPEVGLFVLPVDTSISAADRIVEIVQGDKNTPVFFSITDVVSGSPTSALAARGVPQQLCGKLMAEYVDKILWQNADPSKLPVKAASDDMFEWVISKAAAKSLNIKLPQVL